VRTIIDAANWRHRYARILADGRSRAFAGAAAVAIAVVGALAAFWGARHALLGTALALPPGVVVSYDGLSFGAGTLHVDGLRVRQETTGLTFVAPSLDVAGIGLGALWGGDRALAMAVHAPHVTLGTAVTMNGLRAAARALTLWRQWRSGFHLQVVDGTVELPSSGGVAAQLALEHVSGTLAVGDRGRLAYNADLDVRDGDATYPVHGIAGLERDAQRHAWSAATLPLAPVLALLGTEPLVVARSGTLRDVVVTFGEDATGAPGDPQLLASAHLEGGELAVGAPPHDVRGLHGALKIADDGLAAPRLVGTIDGVPLEVAGETHDLHGGRFAWLGDGSSDLRALVRLAAQVGSQDHVQSVKLETVAPGIAFAQYAVIKPYGPLVVTVVGVDPKEPTLRFDTVLAGDHITSGGERTSAMGARTGAVAGINGDYYDIGGSWAPQGVVIRSGVLLRTPIERMALTVHRDKRVTFQEYQFRGTVRIGSRELPLTQLNSWPAGDVTLMTPDFGKIPPAPGVTLAELVPVDGRAGRFRILRVLPADGETAPTFALAIGPLVHAPLRAGDLLDIRYAVTPSAEDAVAAIGGGPLLLRNGAWYEDPHPPAPDEREVHWAVVAVGRTPDDSLLIFQVDGRHPERSIGITRPDFAELMRGFGVTDAMALDSGGSSTIVSRPPGEPEVTVRNRPSDNDGERWVSNGLFVYSSAGPGTLLVTSKPSAGVGQAPTAP
jgi:hypothetical protein